MEIKTIPMSDLQADPAFREMVAKSKASARKPFPMIPDA